MLDGEKQMVSAKPGSARTEFFSSIYDFFGALSVVTGPTIKCCVISNTKSLC